jgi:hypothetical protein
VLGPNPSRDEDLAGCALWLQASAHTRDNDDIGAAGVNGLHESGSVGCADAARHHAGTRRTDLRFEY